MKSLLECPIVYHDGEMIGYGGNQDWFKEKWSRRAGCASVSGANTLIYYTKENHNFTKDEYLEYMNHMFTIMEPKKRGFPYVFLYARGLKKALSNQDRYFDYKIIRRPNVPQGISFLKEAIDNGNPIGLLVLIHRRRALRDDLWHWVTIFGYEENDGEIDVIFSDCGKRKSVPAKILFEKHRFNIIKMVRMYEKK